MSGIAKRAALSLTALAALGAGSVVTASSGAAVPQNQEQAVKAVYSIGGGGVYNARTVVNHGIYLVKDFGAGGLYNAKLSIALGQATVNASLDGAQAAFNDAIAQLNLVLVSGQETARLIIKQVQDAGNGAVNLVVEAVKNA